MEINNTKQALIKPMSKIALSIMLLISPTLFATEIDEFDIKIVSAGEQQSQRSMSSVAAKGVSTDSIDESADITLGVIPDYIERQNVEERLQPYGDDLLGDSLDINSGTVSFNNVDVSLPGNFKLPVAISRSRKSRYLSATTDAAIRYESLPRGPKTYMADWDLDIPSIRWKYPIPLAEQGNQVVPSAKTRDFCGRNYTTAALVVVQTLQGISITGDAIPHHDLSNELDLNVPGFGSQKLLEQPKGLNFSDEVVKVTKDYWKATCISANNDAQGLEVTSPEGTIYTFDKFFYAPSSGARIAISVDMPTIKLDSFRIVPTVMSTLLPSRVTDINGNWVAYEYDGALLTRIDSSDERAIDITYVDNKISTITANERTWTYIYETNASGYDYLAKVERPDDLFWQYNFGAKPLGVNNRYDCEVDDVTWSATHPNGVTGTFVFAETYHWKTASANEFPSSARECDPEYVGSFKAVGHYEVMSLSSKTLSGPGFDAYVWSFNYQGKTGTSSTKWSESIAPDNTQTRHVFHNSGVNEGLKKEVNIYQSSGALVSKTAYEYKVEEALGITYLLNEEQAKLTSPRHTSKITQEVNDDTYTVASIFNTDQTSDDYSFGAPVGRTESNTFSSHKKMSEMTYEHHKDVWKLRMPTGLSWSDDGETYVETSAVEYYPSTHESSSSLPKLQKSFGQLVKEFTEYHSDGNLKKVEFNTPLTHTGATGNRYQKFSDFKRGFAQTVDLPARDNSGEIRISKEVDDNGWVTSTTDFNGNVTGYEYDEIGNLLAIDSPQKVGETTWTDTLFTWTYDGGANNDQPVRTVNKCTLNATKNACSDAAVLTETTTLDSLLRPTLVETSDGTDAVYQKSTFNAYNQPTFQSFPYNNADDSPSTKSDGTTFNYDALQRLSSQSVTGGGTVTTEYLTANKVKVTDAEDNETTTTYLAYGSPSYEQATKVESPENVTTDIDINLFGNITSITQSGKNGDDDISQTEYRAYDSQHRLCQIERNDVGTTVLSNNVLGEVQWQAQGQTATSNTSCNMTANANDKVNYTYDNLGDQRTINYGDGTPTRTFTLDGNGNIETIVGGGFSQSYNYNSLNLLEDETLNIDGKALKLDYGYSSLGHLASLQYPDELEKVDFEPNGFGQATQAIRTYADTSIDDDVFVIAGATYYPSGSINTFTYGNDVVHKTTLNSRLMPASITDKLGTTSPVDLTYLYDNNSNITKITNARGAGIYNLSALTYDGLDRLKTTTGGDIIGSSALTYDGLGNIRTYSNTSLSKPSKLTYNYKTNFLLNDVVITDTSTKVRDFSADKSYDPRGNVLKNGNEKRTFTYNLANQMTSSEANDSENTYLYDGYNRRVRTNDSKGTSYSMYSQSGKLLYRKTDKGGINYIFLGSKLVAKEGTGVVSSGDSIMNYKPFGDSIETPKDDVGFTGHKFDTDLGLSYMQARYYDPVIGRFYSNDPVGFNNVHNFNRYAYANNNPYKYVDPDGKEARFVGGSAPQVMKAYGYIASNSPTGAKIFNSLLSKSTPVVEISLTTGETKMTLANKDQNAKISWNPKEGLGPSGGAQSPATGLVHELIHTQNPAASEEAVTTMENSVSKETGEGTRTNYADGAGTEKDNVVSGPTCRKTSEGESCG